MDSLRLPLASKKTNSWGYCVHIQNVWFCPVALPALVPLLFVARVVCWPWLAASELKVAFAFPTACSATSPILLLLLVHQGQIARPPCKLTKRWTTATTRHCLMFALAYCIDPASTTLLWMPWPTNFAVGFCCWWELQQQQENFQSIFHFLFFFFFFFFFSQCYVFLTSKDARRNEFHWRK